ncbi:MAG: peptidylprolyl isomerase [Crocinitomicaceae bacterium]|nr:peptidylprolyl isomerase [Crocinitomicaceae bacterium]
MRTAILIAVCFLAFCLLNGCEEEPVKNNVEEGKPVKKKAKPKQSLIEYAKPKPKEKRPKNPITDENVEQRLLEYGKKNPETIVKIYTSKGLIKARLYKDTPLHRANFIMMSKKGFLNGSVFTRVVMNFIAQSGGTFDEDHAAIKQNIGRYTVPAEMKKHRFHKKGAIAAARRYGENPDKRSDPYAFYFVEGTQYNKPTLDVYEREHKYVYSKQQREYYMKYPGAAHLDGQHTVFGEIISGNSVVSKITEVETDSRDWPKKDLFIDSVVVVR